MERVCHIVPAVPPEFNGLGDYARQLWRHWPEPKPEWHVAALRVPAGAQEAWPGVEFHPFQPTAASLLQALHESRADMVALHYVGHGYHPKGIPLWLPRALAEWKRATGGRAVTYFHELWATALPWRLTAWVLPVAAGLVSRVAGCGDSVMTSCFDYERRLSLLVRGTKPVQRVPVGANIEPKQAIPLKPWPSEEPDRSAQEALRVLVFGTGGMRRLILRDHLDTLSAWARARRPMTLVLAGRSDSPSGEQELARLATYLGSVHFEGHYDLSEGEASDVIASGDIGLIHNPWGILHKSGSYAACCQHGLPVLIPKRPTPRPAPVFVAEGSGRVRPADAGERVAEQSRTSWQNIVASWVSQQ